MAKLVSVQAQRLRGRISGNLQQRALAVGIGLGSGLHRQLKMLQNPVQPLPEVALVHFAFQLFGAIQA